MLLFFSGNSTDIFIFIAYLHRADKITTAMAGMPARLEKYEQEMQDRKPVKDMYYQIKRAVRIAKNNK